MIGVLVSQDAMGWHKSQHHYRCVAHHLLGMPSAHLPTIHRSIRGWMFCIWDSQRSDSDGAGDHCKMVYTS